MDESLYQLLQQGATLLTASRHLSHVLREEYAQAAQDRGLQIWPTPRILPWSAYLRIACQQQRDGSHGTPRLLSEQQSLALWERIVAASDSGKALLNPAQAARNAQRSWQRLHQYRIPLHKVGAYPTEEAQAFFAWARQFLDATASKGWLDSARFAAWLHDGDFLPDGDLVVYGFDDYAPDMQSLLQRWQERGVAVHRPKAAPRQALVQVLAAKDERDELIRAASWARAQAETGRQRVAVVVPRLTAQAAQAQRRFTEAFAPAQRSINAASEPLAFRIVATPPLSSYPLVQHALLLLQLLQGRADVLLVGQVLRSPFFAGYDAEAAPRALADIAARELRQEYWNCNDLERLATTHQCGELAACMQAAGNYLRQHRQHALPSQWTERFTRLLQLSGWPRGRALDSVEQQTLNKFQQTLAELSALDELSGRLDLSEAAAAVRNACNAASFAPESSDQAVTISDVDSIAGMQFDALWVMGLHAGDWPPAPEPDPFLPLELQRGSGLPNASAEQCLRLARRKLQRLMQAADQVVLSWPQHDDDEELRPSPLLNGFAHIASALDGHLSLGEQLFNARPTMEAFVDEVAPLQLPGSVKGGTRILELQSRCPFRAQAELRLFARPIPVVSPAVEATERGILVHRVLTEVWQQLKDSQGLQRALEAHSHSDPALDGEATTLHATVRRIAERVAQQVLSATTVHRQRLATLEVELCTQWIMALLQLEAGRLPFRVQRTEQIESYEVAGLQIGIQLDRIDELPDGGKLLVDYKTGASNTAGDWLDREPGRPRSPQLPLYALAHRQQLAGIAFAVLAPGKAEFRGLGDTDSIAPGIADYSQLKPSYKLPGVETWDELLEHWRNVLNMLAQQYLSGAAYVRPLKNECAYCHLRSLCRVHELLENVELETEEGGDA